MTREFPSWLRRVMSPPGADKRSAAHFLVWVALLVLGCASYQDVRVTSNPPGAEVFLDQTRMGETPVDLRLLRDRDHSVYVKKQGYTPELVLLTLRTARDGRKFLTPADVFVDLADRGGAPERLRSPADAQPRTPGAAPSEPAEPGSAQRDRDLQIQPDTRDSEKKGPRTPR